MSVMAMISATMARFIQTTQNSDFSIVVSLLSVDACWFDGIVMFVEPHLFVFIDIFLGTFSPQESYRSQREDQIELPVCVFEVKDHHRTYQHNHPWEVVSEILDMKALEHRNLFFQC